MLNDLGTHCAIVLSSIPLAKKSPIAAKEAPHNVDEFIKEINLRVDYVSQSTFLAGKIGQLYMTQWCNEMIAEPDEEKKAASVKAMNKTSFDTTFCQQLCNAFAHEKGKMADYDQEPHNAISSFSKLRTKIKLPKRFNAAGKEITFQGSFQQSFVDVHTNFGNMLGANFDKILFRFRFIKDHTATPGYETNGDNIMSTQRCIKILSLANIK